MVAWKSGVGRSRRGSEERPDHRTDFALFHFSSSFCTMSSHAQGTGNVWRKLAAASLSLLLSRSVVAQPAMLSYDDCFSGSNTTQKLSVSTVYAQLIGTDYLNLTVIGQSNIPIIGRANSSSNLGSYLSS